MVVRCKKFEWGSDSLDGWFMQNYHFYTDVELRMKMVFLIPN